MVTRNQLYFLLAAAILVIIIIGQYFNFQTKGDCKFQKYSPENGGSCLWKVISYHSSPFETLWLDNAQEWKFKICEKINEQTSEVDTWVRRTDSKTFDEGVFSYFELENVCTGDIIREYIEPLAGLTRHPYTCRDGKWLLDKAYLLTSCSRYFTNDTHKAWYFDLGASTWNSGAGGSSQNWVYEHYKACGVVFDGLFMWEAAHIDPVDVWKAIPQEIQPRYRWYNIPANPDPQSSANPLNFIRAVVKPEDFLVLKIDIDNSTVEDQFIKQMLNDTHLQSLVDEFFFEHHVYAQPLASCCWGITNQSVTIVDTFKIFIEMRRAGVRAHGWV